MNYGAWFIKMVLLFVMTKWMIESYDIVEIQIQQDNDANFKAFDPYRLLHIDKDGSFNTTAIHLAYDKLAYKYHPKKVNPEKVPMDKAIKRWQNLNKAYGTLTEPDMFENYNLYGDPRGSKTVTAVKLLYPNWIFEEDMRPMLITWAVVGGIFLLLALSILCKQATQKKTKSGLEPDSKVNMKEFMIAILEDNAKSERTIGYSDVDIVEIYQQTMEIQDMEE